MRKSNRARVLQEAKKATLSEKEFWLSPRTRTYFDNIVLCITKRYKAQDRVSMRIIYDSPSITGYTDGRSITLNSNCDIFKPLGERLEVFKAFTGMCLHEIAHCLYTDTTLATEVTKNLRIGKFEPIKPVEDFSEIEKLISSSENASYKANVFSTLFHQIWNILEDGYIEYRFLKNYPQPSFQEGLLALRELHSKGIPSFEESLANETSEESKIYTICNMLLSYCKYGEIKCDKTSENDERVTALKKCIPYIDKLNASNNNTTRIRLVFSVIKVLEDYIIPLLKDIENDQDADDANNQLSSQGPAQPEQDSSRSSGSSNQKQIVEDEEEKDEDDGLKGSNDSCNSSEDEDNDEPTGSKNEDSEDTDETTEQSKKEENDGNSEDKDSSQGSSSSSDDGDEEIDPSSSNSSDMDSKDSTKDNDEPSDSSSGLDEEDEKAEGQNSQKSDTNSNKDNKTSEFDEGSVLENALNKLENEAKEDKAAQKLDDESCRELENEYKDCIIYRAPFDESLVYAYNNLYPEIQKTSKAIIKAYRQKMKDRATGGISRGLYNGSRLESRSYYRYDKRIFAKKNAPTEIEKLAVALVIDESGSMWQDHKIDTARMFALILHDVCTNLGIELMIIGHTDNQEVFDYCNFGGSYDDKDKYRLLTIQDRGGDSAYHAFKMAANAIEKKTIAENKMIIMLSDGLPNYGKEELKALSKRAKTKKINVVAASIGCDIDRMKEIYGDNTLNIEDINALPKTLMNCIKRYLD